MRVQIRNELVCQRASKSGDQIMSGTGAETAGTARSDVAVVGGVQRAGRSTVPAVTWRVVGRNRRGRLPVRSSTWKTFRDGKEKLLPVGLNGLFPLWKRNNGEHTEVIGGKGSVGPGGDARIEGAKGGGGITFIGGSIRGGDGGEGSGKGGDATVAGGDG